jgi:xylulokinase
VATAQSHILAIDLGTSTLKAALVTTSGEVTAYETDTYPLHVLPGGGVEQDPADWWAAIERAVTRLLGRGEVRPDSVIGIGTTTQWSGTVPVNAAGEPLRRAIIWMDTRGVPHVGKITTGPLRLSCYGVDKLWHWVRKTGGVPARSGKDSLAHILWLKNEEPEVYRAAYKFLEPKDYLNLRLTGRAAASYDSITLHWVTDNRDLARVRYDDTLLKLAGLEREQLPDLRSSVDILGPLRQEVAATWGLPDGIPVVVGSPDLPAAAVGSGAIRDYQPHIHVGTSAWITCHVPFKRTDLLHNMACLPSAIPGRYFVANEQETAGACVQFLLHNLAFCADELGLDPDLDEALELFTRVAAAAPAGSGGVIFTPWLVGERTPVEDPFVRGGFHNLSLDTRRPHVFRAVLEGVAYNARWLLGAVESFVRRRLDPIRIIGGGGRSDLWCQIFADVLGRGIEQVGDPPLAGVRGAAILAVVGIGATSFDAVADQVPVARTYVPDPSHREVYARLFREFVRLYYSNRGSHTRLNAW